MHVVHTFIPVAALCGLSVFEVFLIIFCVPAIVYCVFACLYLMQKEAELEKKRERVLMLNSVRPLVLKAAIFSLIAAVGTATTIKGRQSGALVRTTVMLAQTGFGIYCLAKWNWM